MAVVVAVGVSVVVTVVVVSVRTGGHVVGTTRPRKVAGKSLFKHQNGKEAAARVSVRTTGVETRRVHPTVGPLTSTAQLGILPTRRIEGASAIVEELLGDREL